MKWRMRRSLIAKWNPLNLKSVSGIMLFAYAQIRVPRENTSLHGNMESIFLIFDRGNKWRVVSSKVVRGIWESAFFDCSVFIFFLIGTRTKITICGCFETSRALSMYPWYRSYYLCTVISLMCGDQWLMNSVHVST